MEYHAGHTLNFVCDRAIDGSRISNFDGPNCDVLSIRLAASYVGRNSGDGKGACYGFTDLRRLSQFGYRSQVRPVSSGWYQDMMCCITDVVTMCTDGGWTPNLLASTDSIVDCEPGRYIQAHSVEYNRHLSCCICVDRSKRHCGWKAQGVSDLIDASIHSLKQWCYVSSVTVAGRHGVARRLEKTRTQSQCSRLHPPHSSDLSILQN